MQLDREVSVLKRADNGDVMEQADDGEVTKHVKDGEAKKQADTEKVMKQEEDENLYSWILESASHKGDSNLTVAIAEDICAIF